MDQYIKDHAKNLTESDKAILLKCKEIQERVKKLEKEQTVKKGDNKIQRKAVQHELLEHNKKKRKLEETVKDAEFKLNEVKKGVQFELNALGDFHCDHKFASDVELDFVKEPVRKSLFDNNASSVSQNAPGFSFGAGYQNSTKASNTGIFGQRINRQCMLCDKFV